VGQGDLAGATGSSSVTLDGPVLDVSAEMSLERFHAGLVAPRGGRHVRGGASIACGNPAATTLGTVERLVRAAGWSRSAWSRAMPPWATSRTAAREGLPEGHRSICESPSPGQGAAGSRAQAPTEPGG
jgi:hypothetical protein